MKIGTKSCFSAPSALYPRAWAVYACSCAGPIRPADKGVSMDVNKVLQELKARPGFTDHVGMMLVHNGVVRGWSRKDHAPVSSITVSHDQAKMDAICHEMEQRPGIFAIVAQANGGELQPGDDLLLLVVAGDIRENVKATFAELLDRIKSEAVIKQEHGPEA